MMNCMDRDVVPIGFVNELIVLYVGLIGNILP